MTAPTLWRDLRQFTGARVALGRVGAGLPTAAHLAFQADHAAARDAVHAALDLELLQADLAAENLPATMVRSACPDRPTYLRRPDLGRKLHSPDRETLHPAPAKIAFVVCDGLSALAVQRHAAPLLALVVPALEPGAKIVVATQARVALGDDVGEALGASAVIVLIGERPGLSTPDSLGVYLTWAPHVGRTDADRNCLSNIRPEGMPIPEGARKLIWLATEMRARKLSGVGLKDEAPMLAPKVDPLGLPDEQVRTS